MEAATPAATTTKTTIPVQGMTCAACQASVQKALQRQPGVLDASVNLMMSNAAVTYDPAVTRPEALVDAIRDTGYEAALPQAGQTAFEEQEARDRAQADEFRDLRRKALVSGAVGVVAMIVSMPLMAAGAHAVHGPVADPFMRWAMESMTPALERGDAVALPNPRGRSLLEPARSDAWRDGLGRAALLHPRLDGLPAPLGGHEHPDRRWARGRRSCTPFVATVAPGVLRLARRGAGRVLRGGDHHHRPDPHRQRARGAGQAPHVGRPARARGPAAEDGPRAAGGGGGGRTRRARCGTATWSSSAPASGCRWTARWSPARARWTSRCSPASRCRSRRRRATG